MKEKVRKFFFWNYDDIKDDVFYKSEIQANKAIAITMFNCALVLLLSILFSTLGIFALDLTKFSTIIECETELLIPAILCFIYKGRKGWLKYVLLISFSIVLARIECLLTYNVPMICIIPVILSCRYYSRKITISAVFATELLMIVVLFARPLTELATDYNVFYIEEIVQIYSGEFELSYWVLVKYYALYTFIPKVLIFEIISCICILSAGKGRQMVEDENKIVEANAKINSELDLATSIQSNMLPSIFPPFPDHDEFDIYASMNPAKSVGGDFYDFFMLDDSNVAIVISDVSGKGIPAALFMVIAKTLIKNQAQSGLSPNETFTKVNQMLTEGNEAGLFVTSFMGVLNIETGLLTFVNAGHNPPLIKHDGKFEYLKTKPGFVLAGIEGFRYEQESITLDINDQIFLYTDGITESTNLNDEQFGTVRLKDYLNSHSNESIKDIVNGIKNNVDEFAKGKEQFDDMTMLLLDFKKKAKKSSMVYKEFEATDSNLSNFLEYIRDCSEDVNLSNKDKMQLEIASEEIFVNIAHYAYNGHIGMMKIGVDKKPDKIVFCYVDYGMPFNPLDKKDPDLTSSAEDRNIGGLGIYMVKKYMDNVEYKYVNGQNILTLTKNIVEDK